MAETIKQLSVLLENKPSRLAQVCTALAKDKVNLTAMTVASHRDQSVLRLVPDNMNNARKTLKQLNVPFSEDDVVLVPMTNRPGALARVCEQLAAEHINIDYAYSSAAGQNGKSLGIFRVSNTPRALKLLADSNARIRRNGSGGKGWGRTGRTTKSEPEATEE